MAKKEVTVKCPFCGSDNVSPHGHNKTGKQVYHCKNQECSHKYFVEEYTYKGYDPEVRKQVLKMAVDCTGTRATSRILGISKDTVTSILKKQEGVLWQVNYEYINQRQNEEMEVAVISSDQIEVNTAEMDEMWSFVHDNSQQYWLWWAIDHKTGTPLAYCFGTREHKYLDELRALLAPFKISTVYADANYAYKAHITESNVVTGKRHTQKIERKHLSLRTWCSRLVRKGIRFSKSHLLHSIVVGLVITINEQNCRNAQIRSVSADNQT